ncbi:hypothetical protein FB446DRAFT_368660 [Lentinula raphanica]|nr:hypothetical protein FB446DRAFT_368660 [Lentinula raphanica]
MSSQSRSSFYDPLAESDFISLKKSRVWSITDLTFPRRCRRPFGRSQFSVVRAVVVLATSSALLGAMTTTGYAVAASPIPQTSAPTSLDTSSLGLPDPSFSSLAPILPSATVRVPHDQTDSVPTGLEDRIDVDDIDTSIQIELSRDDPFREDDGGSSLPPTIKYDAGDRAHGQVLGGLFSTDSRHLELNLNHSNHLIHLKPRQEPLQKDLVLLGFAYHTSLPEADSERSGSIGLSSREGLGPDDMHPGLRNLKIPGLSLEPFEDTFLYLLENRPEPNSALGMWDRDENEAGMPHEAHTNPSHLCGVYAKIPKEFSFGGFIINRRSDMNYHRDSPPSIKDRGRVKFFYRRPPKRETKTNVFSKLISKLTNTKIPVVEFPEILAGQWKAYAVCKPREFFFLRVSSHKFDVASGAGKSRRMVFIYH